MHNMTVRIVVMQFPFSDEVWSLFEYVILHELLQDYNVIWCIDGGFCQRCMSVYHAVVIKESNNYNHIRGSSLFLFTQLRSKRVVMCLVVVYIRSFVPSLTESRVFNIF